MQNHSPQRDHTVKFILLIVLALVFLYLGKFLHVDKEVFKSFLSSFPLLLSGIIFVTLYVILTFFIWLGPKDVLRIVAQIIYGLSYSTILIYIAEMINVVVLFKMSRKLGRGFVESKLKGGMQRLDNAIADTSYWGIFFMRFFPIIPLRFLDLGFGLTKISLKKYFILAAISSPIRIFVIQFLLSLGMETLKDPHLFAEYLMEHSFVFMWCTAYVVGSIVMVIVLKIRSKRIMEKED